MAVAPCQAERKPVSRLVVYSLSRTKDSCYWTALNISNTDAALLVAVESGHRVDGDTAYDIEDKREQEEKK